MANSDQNLVAYAQVVAQAWEDEAYKAQILANPSQVLTGAGIDIPAPGTIQVLEDTEAIRYLVLPEGTSFADSKDQIATALDLLLPLSADQEVVIRQSTKDTKYFVLPRSPELKEGEQFEERAKASCAAVVVACVVSVAMF